MSNTLQNKLTHDQITVICQHGFGSGVKLTSVQPLEGGTVNETYLVELDGKPRMVLRVAPAFELRSRIWIAKVFSGRIVYLPDDAATLTP